MRVLLLLLIPIFCLTSHGEEKEKKAPSAAAEQPGHGGHAEGTASGIKRELIAGLTKADFIRLSDKPTTVKVLLVAVWSDDNYGMNFNGYSKGAALYTIPKDWTVEVTFINPAPIPHSLVVIEKELIKKLQVPEPYFKGAAVPEHLKGVAFQKVEFSFVADEAGEFAFACGFPAHTLNGHWIGLDVSAEAKVPTLKLGDGPAIEATH